MSHALTVIAGRYRVLRTLGAGGMASVVLAEDELLRRRVAVKLLHPHGDEAMARRLLREAKIGASLSHPNLVIVFDTLLHETELVVVMEYVEGETLAQARASGPIDPRRGLGILQAVAAGLDHAHEHGVVHRDVKPQNVLLGPAGVVKLADLGIAHSADSSRITETGTALGSVSYMAPEQLMGERGTPATDVYGLAVVAFELLGGRKAYTGTTPMAIVEQVANGPAPDLRETWPQAPPAAAEAIRRAMATDPRERPARAGDFVAELSSALAPPVKAPPAAVRAQPPVAARGPSRPPTLAPAPQPRRRAPAASRRWLPVAIAVAALLLVGGGLASLLRGGGGGGSGGGDSRPDALPQGSRGGESAAEARGQDATSPQAGATPTPTPGDQAAGATPAPQPPAATRSTTGAESVMDPVGAVRAFYGRAARHDTIGVCALRGPELRIRFSCTALTSQFATLRSIRFRSLSLQSRTARAATVALATTARHTDRVDRCRGTIDLVPGGAGEWLVNGLAVACARA